MWFKIGVRDLAGKLRVWVPRAGVVVAEHVDADHLEAAGRRGLNLKANKRARGYVSRKLRTGRGAGDGARIRRRLAHDQQPLPPRHLRRREPVVQLGSEVHARELGPDLSRGRRRNGTVPQLSEEGRAAPSSPEGRARRGAGVREPRVKNHVRKVGRGLVDRIRCAAVGATVRKAQLSVMVAGDGWGSRAGARGEG